MQLYNTRSGGRWPDDDRGADAEYIQGLRGDELTRIAIKPKIFPNFAAA